MNAIGGYFELELRKGDEYHKNAIRLNTARNALELILRIKNYTKVYISFFTCDAILEPFNKLSVEYEFYTIDKYFEPRFNYSNVKNSEAFLYTNYFGIKDSFIFRLSKVCSNLIIDNSQSFYSDPLPNIPTFYFPRKFFGIPDGAYLYLEGVDANDYPVDISIDRFNHLFKRIEFGAEAGYMDFKFNDNSFIDQPIKQMSKLTIALLRNIDYGFIRHRRRENFQKLHEHFSSSNGLKITLNKESVPLVYPYLTENTNLKQKLINNKIFVPTYWPNILNWTDSKSIEYKYTLNIVYFPIDQRNDIKEMNQIIKKV